MVIQLPKCLDFRKGIKDKDLLKMTWWRVSEKSGDDVMAGYKALTAVVDGFFLSVED